MQFLFLLMEILVKCVVVFGALMLCVAYIATYFYPALVNDLLITGWDPVGRHPEYKVFVGRVEKR